MNKTATQNFNKSEIKIAIDTFLIKRTTNSRDASFDYCYNYFQAFKDNPSELVEGKNLELSCLHLWAYLASWGMLRGSSFLLKEKSFSHLRFLMEEIASHPDFWKQAWQIDADKYGESEIKLLLEAKERIIRALGKENTPSEILVSKIMLGIFANVPAFDENFKKFLKKGGYCQTFNEKSLRDIKGFYDETAEQFDLKIKTLDCFASNKESVFYTKAKLIDMYGFITGETPQEEKP